MRYYRNYIVTTADLVHEQSKLLYPNNHSVGYSITTHKFVEVRNRQTLAIWKPSEFWKMLTKQIGLPRTETGRGYLGYKGSKPWK